MSISFPHASRELSAQIALPLLFATNGLFLGMWIASIPEITGALDLTRGELGTVLSAFPLGGLAAFPLAAVLMSRTGSRASILGFGVLRILAFPLLALASSDVALAGALAIVGFAHGGLDVSLNSQGVEIERQIGHSILSRAHAAYSIGTLSGSLGAGLIEQTGVPLVPLFLVPSLFAMVMFWLSRRSLFKDEPPATRAESPVTRTSKWQVIKVPPAALGIVLAIAFVTEIADEAICDWFAIHLREDLYSLPAVASLDYSVFAFAILIGRIFGDAISNRVPPMRLLQFCGVVGSFGILVGVGIDTTAAMLIGTGITGLGYSLILPTLYRVAGSVPNVARSTALATVATAVYLGYLVGPLVIGPVANATSLRLALLGVGVLFLAVPALARMGQTMSDRLGPNPTFATAISSHPGSKHG